MNTRATVPKTYLAQPHTLDVMSGEIGQVGGKAVLAGAFIACNGVYQQFLMGPHQAQALHFGLELRIGLSADACLELVVGLLQTPDLRLIFLLLRTQLPEIQALPAGKQNEQQSNAPQAIISWRKASASSTGFSSSTSRLTCCIMRQRPASLPAGLEWHAASLPGPAAQP